MSAIKNIRIFTAHQELFGVYSSCTFGKHKTNKTCKQIAQHTFLLYLLWLGLDIRCSVNLLLSCYSALHFRSILVVIFIFTRCTYAAVFVATNNLYFLRIWCYYYRRRHSHTQKFRSDYTVFVTSFFDSIRFNLCI